MREATLGGLSALDTVQPGRSAARPRKAGGPAGKAAKRPDGNFRRLRARFALIVGSAGFSAIMIGIVLNATVMQKEHHPAPLFGGGVAPAPPPRVIPTPPPVAVEPAATVPAPVVDLPAAPASAPLPLPATPAGGQNSKPATVARTLSHAPTHAGTAHPGATHATPAHRPDAIGQLLGQSGGADLHQRAAHAPAGTPTRALGKPTPGKAPQPGAAEATTVRARAVRSEAATAKAPQGATGASVPRRTIPVATGGAATAPGVN